MTMKNGDHWPADMVTEILLKLPIKSTLRFKCVSKTWFDLFQNPSFVSKYNRIRKTKNKRLIISYIKDDGRHDGRHDYENVVRTVFDQNLVSHHDLLQQLPSHLSNTFRICVEDGLVCLCDIDDETRMTIWNPATKEFRTLPLPLPQCDKNIAPNIYISDGACFGFGLDPLSNDYKVIYECCYCNQDYEVVGSPYYVVYKMSSDSWRELKKEDVKLLEVLQIKYGQNNACANGVFYWNAIDRNPSFKRDDYKLDYKVLAFNFSTEVFQLIPDPPYNSLGQLVPLHDGRISFWDTQFFPDRKPTNEVWVLNDEGNWTKLLKIETVFEVATMYGFWENGKQVLMESQSGRLLLYDLESEQVRDLDAKTIETTHYGPCSFSVYIYEESLFALR